MRPWLQVEPHFSPAEWQGLVEYLAAPYVPGVDTPVKKPWAYKRHQQGQTAPWTDRFQQIDFEIGNETWNSLFRPWVFDDMTDAVDWAIGQGIADKNRICTYGASYGGYAALQTVVREPNKYRCTIGYVGVYSLPLMFKDGDIPETESGRNFQNRVLPEGLAAQQAQSPAYNIDKIRIPVMLVQGAKDLRVPISQYELLKKNLEKAGRPPEVTIVEDKEGHGFYDYQNQVDLYTKMEAFLDKHLGANKPSTSP